MKLTMEDFSFQTSPSDRSLGGSQPLKVLHRRKVATVSYLCSKDSRREAEEMESYCFRKARSIPRV